MSGRTSIGTAAVLVVGLAGPLNRVDSLADSPSGGVAGTRFLSWARSRADPPPVRTPGSAV